MLPTLLFLALAPGPAPLAADPAPAGADGRPNVVVLVVDDMDYEHFRALGCPLAPTPTLDELARTGVVFTHGFVPMSRCRPSQASLLTGMWPHQNGVYFNVGADHIDPATALPNLLREAGYATVGEGKFWEYEARVMGFSNYTLRNYETFVRWEQRHLFSWLEQHAGEQPFFVWWAPELPHVPHDPPERLLQRFPLETVPVPDWFRGDEAERAEFRRRERALLAMDAWLDEGVAELIAELKALDEYDDTLFVLYNDNGWANGCVSKGWALEKGLRTPFLLAGPGIAPAAAGSLLGDLVSPVDLYATILDYAGRENPEWSQGRSLRPRLEGRPGEPRTALYGALYPLQSSEDDADAARDAYALWARTERWKFILTLKDLTARADAGSDVGEREDVKVSLAPDFVRRRGQVELYDLEADPHEQNDLSGRPEHAELEARLRGEILEWWRSTGGGSLDVP